MSGPRTQTQSGHRGGNLEPAAQQGNNGPRVPDGDKPDRRIVALVKLLARLAAEQDFRDEPNER